MSEVRTGDNLDPPSNVDVGSTSAGPRVEASYANPKRAVTRAGEGDPLTGGIYTVVYRLALAELYEGCWLRRPARFFAETGRRAACGLKVVGELKGNGLGRTDVRTLAAMHVQTPCGGRRACASLAVGALL